MYTQLARSEHQGWGSFGEVESWQQDRICAFTSLTSLLGGPCPAARVALVHQVPNVVAGRGGRSWQVSKWDDEANWPSWWSLLSGAHRVGMGSAQASPLLQLCMAVCVCVHIC